MRCRPSEVDEEDEADVALWLTWDLAEAEVAKRERKRQERELEAARRQSATHHGRGR